MKLKHFSLFLIVIGSFFVTSSSKNFNQCNKGPAYWCEHISNAKQCNAVTHCIQTVWEKQFVPEDNDSVCKICLDMVKEARDQLQSNETQNDLKAVFEGSCKLIVVKPIVKECTKLVDDFIPELIEALSSQMDPQVVCSVAGLCNNAYIDQLLLDYKEEAISTISSPIIDEPKPKPVEDKRLSCEQCGLVSSIISTKFKVTSRDDMLDSILSLCGHAGSFSDACASIALTYFKSMYEYLSANADAKSICHMSGTCASKYHQHPEDVQIQNWSSVGVLSSKDDIPCELCEQLVHHLQEVLTANTTEIEFKQVLEGLCKQTKGFKAECLSIADQYYDKIYQTLVHNLDANGACYLIGVCPKGSANGFFKQKDIKPLIPYVEPAKVKINISKIDNDSPKYSKDEINSMQLPIDLIAVQSPVTGNAELCTMCEYFLHFVQETLATPATEEKIKDTVIRLCNKFPSSLKGNCHDFVDMYGDAVIALLIQGFNPREMCPMMDLCPKNVDKDVAIVTTPKQSESDKATCPMCLFAVQQAQELIKDNKSKKNIKTVLDNLCSHLSGKLENECVDFVETYSNELIDMLITDFTPQEICVYIKLCPSNIKSLDWPNINTDEAIIDELFKEDSSNVNEEEKIVSPECLLCEKVIAEAEKKMGPAKTKADIEKELYKACGKLKKLADKCHKYIDEYGDKIAALILDEMTPKQICKELGYCSWKDTETKDTYSKHEAPKTAGVDDPPCLLCELIIKKLENKLKDKKTEEEIKQEVENICKAMPKKLASRCDQFIEKYGDLIIAMVQTVPPKEICKNLGLCPMKMLDDVKPKDTPLCMLCEIIIKQLENELNDNATASEIKSVVENICKIMPGSIEDSCDQFIEQYGNMIIQLLQSLPPKEICSNLMLCSGLENKLNDQVVECGICYGATSRLLTYINGKDDLKIRSQTMIGTVCNDLPGKYYEKCSELLTYYGKSIRNLINRKTDQSKICVEIGKCFDDENSGLSYVRIL